MFNKLLSSTNFNKLLSSTNFFNKRFQQISDNFSSKCSTNFRQLNPKSDAHKCQVTRLRKDLTWILYLLLNFSLNFHQLE